MRASTIGNGFELKFCFNLTTDEHGQIDIKTRLVN
jgi:hypothetical protein